MSKKGKDKKVNFCQGGVKRKMRKQLIGVQCILYAIVIAQGLLVFEVSEEAWFYNSHLAEKVKIISIVFLLTLVLISILTIIEFIRGWRQKDRIRKIFLVILLISTVYATMNICEIDKNRVVTIISPTIVSVNEDKNYIAVASTTGIEKKLLVTDAECNLIKVGETYGAIVYVDPLSENSMAHLISLFP